MKKTVRINLEVSPDYTKRLENLQENIGATSKAEVFRRAVAALELITAVNSQGAKLVVEHPNGDKETLVVL